MYKKLYISFFFLLISFIGVSQNSLSGAGNCLEFDGLDDYIEVTQSGTNNYKLPLTVTAWIFMDPNKNGVFPIFSSHDGGPKTAGIHVWLTDTTINAGFSNGSTGAFELNTRIKEYATDTIKGAWMHIAAVVNTTGISLYLNGIQIGGQIINPTINYNLVNSGIPVIGRKTTGSQVDYYKGKLDEVVIWDKALSPVEVRQNMCVKPNNTSASVNRYFRLDQLSGNSVIDLSVNQTNGTVVSNPQLVTSGAAIGDQSSYVYQTGSWQGYTHQFTASGNDKITVSNVLNDPDGLQIYWVKGAPNNFTNIDWICAEEGFIGVFICRQSLQDYNYNMSFDFSGNLGVNTFIPNASDISLKQRRDNTKSWGNAVANAPPNRQFNLTQEITRKEYSLSGIHTPPSISFPDTITCADSIEFSLPLNAVYKYLWSNGSKLPTTIINQSGTYWFEYGDSCGTQIIRDTFDVSMGFSNLSIGNDTTLCTGETLLLSTGLTSAQHLWQDGSTQSSFLVSQPGTYYVTASYGPCSGGDTVIVNYESVVPFSLGSDTAFCFGDSILLDASSSGANVYLWNTGETTPSIWATTSSNYSVVAGASCKESSSINVDVLLENISISKDTTICNGQEAILIASGGTSYLWNTGETSNRLVVIPSSTTTYSVDISDQFCTTTLEVKVTVDNNIAEADFNYEVNSCKGEVTFENTSYNATIFYWDFGDGNYSSEENPKHAYAQGGTFDVKLVATKNGCPDTTIRPVKVNSLKDIIYFPTAFTPNEDNFNPTFHIKGAGQCFINAELRIYNRWGNIVFHTLNPFQEFWDGYYNGAPVEGGVYQFVFNADDFSRKGLFTLYR